MQIFVLDPDPTAAAQQLVDVHVGSQLRESVQMLYTVLHSYGEPVTEPFPGPDKPLEPYKPYKPYVPPTVDPKPVPNLVQKLAQRDAQGTARDGEEKECGSDTAPRRCCVCCRGFQFGCYRPAVQQRGCALPTDR